MATWRRIKISSTFFPTRVAEPGMGGMVIATSGYLLNRSSHQLLGETLPTHRVQRLILLLEQATRRRV